MGSCICAVFKSSIFYIVLTALICLSINVGINLSISYLCIFLIDEFIPSYYYLKLLLIPILFAYNYLILRHVVIHWIFEWQFPFQIFSIYKERQIYVNYLKARVNGFLSSIDKFLTTPSDLTENDIGEIVYFPDIFGEEFYIYDNLYNLVIADNGIHNNNLIRYKMSRNQINYYNVLKNIDTILNENDLRNKLKGLNLFNDGPENTNKMDNNKEIIPSLTRLKNALTNELLPIMEKYSWENYTYMSPAYVYNLIFNDTFGSLSLYALQFKKNFQDYLIEENYTSNGKILYTLIRNIKQDNKDNLKDNNEIITEEKLIIEEKGKNDDGNLLFFCLPNGGCYELLPKGKVEFYLTHGFSFLCWNYRGYGYSKGSTNFSRCKEDALDVFDTVVSNKKYNFKKICVMGHSIGGIAVSHVARNRHVDFIISDRNFCDLPRIVKNFHCGSVLSFLLKCLLVGKTDIIENLMDTNGYNNIEKIQKMIVYSPNDALIVNDSSVKSGIARYIIKNFIIYKNNINNTTIKSKENFLDIVFDSNEKNLFLNNLIDLIHRNHDYALNFQKNIPDDVIQQEEKPILIHKHDISYPFLNVFFEICCDNLIYIAENQISIRRQKLFLDNFFNNLLIWGAQGEENYPNEETFEFYSYKGLKIIKEAYDILNKNQIDEISVINNIKLYFRKILNVMQNLEIDLNRNNNSNSNKINSLSISNLANDNYKEKLIITEEGDELNTDNTNNNNVISTNIELIDKNNLIDDNNNNAGVIVENNFYDKLNNIIGNFKIFRTFAGHNGSLRMEEKEQFFCLLLKNGIIN